MTHNVSEVKQVGDTRAFFVQVTDEETASFLAALENAGGDDFAETDANVALWATEVPNGEEAGSAYVVSPEAYKRVQARRF